jgi:hypothetical protein
LGRHDVWVTAIDYQGADPVYYDGELASINRVRSADISGNGEISILDLLYVISVLGETGDYTQDLNADGMVNMFDIFIIIENFGRCISSTGSLYEAC